MSPREDAAPESPSQAAESVERALSALEAQGARAYDAPACECARALLARAGELDAAIATILVARAQAHVESLAERFARDRARVLERLEQLGRNHEAYLPLRDALERGELLKVGRTLRRIAVSPVAAKRLLLERNAVSEAPPPRFPTQRPPSMRPPSMRPPSMRPPSMPPPRKQRAVAYEDSVAAMVASFALARAVDVVPEDAGPYNPLRIASATLDRIREVSPFFLTVQLNRLEELASLLALPELPAPPAEEKKVLPKGKPQGKSQGKSGASKAKRT